ncbi:uncharacterized protein LOC118200496 [Stegodyphus dumicola]|uniref:uncharacterized protein LOC118200496 n=1 Tax=Stegodyphus dumicola TaxID=202533 RepID=UPI0015AF9418|nr:uncharacterized protein LOC118200496 [Stegodyphus dumicola]
MDVLDTDCLTAMRNREEILERCVRLLRKSVGPDYIYSPREARLQKQNRLKNKTAARREFLNSGIKQEDTTSQYIQTEKEDWNIDSKNVAWDPSITSNGKTTSSPEYVPNNPQFVPDTDPLPSIVETNTLPVQASKPSTSRSASIDWNSGVFETSYGTPYPSLKREPKTSYSSNLRLEACTCKFCSPLQEVSHVPRPAENPWTSGFMGYREKYPTLIRGNSELDNNINSQSHNWEDIQKPLSSYHFSSSPFNRTDFTSYGTIHPNGQLEYPYVPSPCIYWNPPSVERNPYHYPRMEPFYRERDWEFKVHGMPFQCSMPPSELPRYPSAYGNRPFVNSEENSKRWDPNFYQNSGPKTDNRNEGISSSEAAVDDIVIDISCDSNEAHGAVDGNNQENQLKANIENDNNFQPVENREDTFQQVHETDV